MYQVRVTKLSDNKNAMRTTSLEGETEHLPQIGKSFVVVGEGLEFGQRLFNTSMVQNIEERDNKTIIKTLNSLYQVEILNKG